MSTPFETIVSKTGEQGETLTEAERGRMRTLLAEYAAFKPVRHVVGHPYGGVLHLFMRPAFAGALMAILLVTGTGAAAYAAEGTLPGDLLYPIKVHVNEPVVTALTPKGSAQIAWQITIATRRLKEASTLSAEGRLATSTATTLIAEAADATLKGAVDAAALSTDVSSTTSASTTATLIQASGFILEGRGRVMEHDDAGASRAFRASIHAASGLPALSGAASTTIMLWDDSIASSSEPHTTLEATSSDSGTAAVIEGVIQRDSDHPPGLMKKFMK